VFAFQDTRGPVEVAFTDRHGGVGGGSSASLDLAVRPGGDGRNQNLDVVGYAFARGRGDRDRPVGLPEATTVPVLQGMRQVHGADVVVVDGASRDRSEVPVADALVTRSRGVVLLVRVADCVPVLLADADAGVVAAVHAGRPGLVAGVVPEAVRVLREQGASTAPGAIQAWLGPRVCGACYEVPAPMRADVSAVVPEAWAETSWGTPSVDIGAGVAAQLRRAGVQVVVDASRCTVEDQDLYSYRREGTDSGRLGGLIWMRP
jgi:YfiH family protein